MHFCRLDRGVRSVPMKFEEYLDSLRGKTVAVIGIGVSNTAR